MADVPQSPLGSDATQPLRISLGNVLAVSLWPEITTLSNPCLLAKLHQINNRQLPDCLQ